MNVKGLVLLCFLFNFASTDHNKPLPLNLWPANCAKGDYILNDCNWCACNAHHKFTCKARVCNEVDMFGHFNDAIRDLNVGMEGKGFWRSSPTPCDPGVQYERDGLMCICGEDGIWPNPACRDSFRVLHKVEVSEKKQIIRSQKCEPTKLYLIGCNVCFCPSKGEVDATLCTKRNCTTDDPVMYPDQKVIERNGDASNDNTLEIYAECQIHHRYKLGCRNCMCLRNNRLICDDCPADGVPKAVPKDGTETYCDSFKPGEIFSMDCNLCFCDDKDLMYCTSRRCLSNDKYSELPKITNSYLQSVEAPYDDISCVPGTKYTKDCNTCSCSQTPNGKKYYACTLKLCSKANNALDAIKADCIPSTRYESSCQICSCSLVRGTKLETCQLNPQCSTVSTVRPTDVSKLHGYCEPTHNYQHGCNTCRCLLDGKTLVCTAQYCEEVDKKEPINVDIVPVMQTSHGAPCPKDHMYKIDCNICFCLNNGNILCTTANCSKNIK